MKIAIASRHHAFVSEWMHRAADRTDRPLPMLIVSGSVGCGKTAVIHAAAEQANVELIEMGSDSTDHASGDKTVTAIATRSSFDRWMQLVRARTINVRALFIDDAEALLMHAKGGKDGLSVDMFSRLGMHAVPVVVAVADWYAGGKLLRDLRTREKNVKHVHLAAPAAMAICRQLAIEYPCVDAERRQAHSERLRRIADACNGDLRRARLDAGIGGVTSELRDMGRACVVGGTASLFDHCKALLGIDGSVPASVATLQREYQPNIPQLANMVRTHAASVTPDDDMELLAATAETWSHLDCGPVALPADYDEFWSLVAVPTMLRRRQRVGRTRPDNVNFAQPLRGAGQGALTMTERRARDTVAAYHRHHWQSLDRQERLVSCPRGVTVREQTNAVESATAMMQLWRVRDEIEALWRIRRPTVTGMLSVDDATALLDEETRPVVGGVRRPWDQVRTLQSDDLSGTDNRARKTGWRQ